LGIIETTPTPALGDRVRAARRERAMSQAQLAGDELTKGFISQVESGLVRPSVRSLQIIATRLGKSLEYFLGDAPLAAEKRLAFHKLAAEAAVERRDWATVRSEVEAALVCEPAKRERASLLRLLAQSELAAARHEAAFDRVTEGLSLLDVNTDASEVAQLLFIRGSAYGQLNQHLTAAEALEQARDTMERHEVNDPRLRSRILVGLGTAYRRLNRTAKAMQTYASALDLASASNELRVAAQGYMGVAVSLYDAGELDSAITNYRRALDLFSRIEDRGFELSVLHSLASVHFERGAIDEARTVAERCVVLAQLSSDTRTEAIAEVILARVALAKDETDEALALAKKAEKAFGENDKQRADALRVIGAANDVLGAHSASDRAYRKAIELLDEVGDAPDRSTIAAEYAKRLRARGDVDAAFHYLDLARGR
jgi:HTH-type transcriptional regulator, quorum sensing regulator NprR